MSFLSFLVGTLRALRSFSAPQFHPSRPGPIVSTKVHEALASPRARSRARDEEQLAR